VYGLSCRVEQVEVERRWMEEDGGSVLERVWVEQKKITVNPLAVCVQRCIYAVCVCVC